MSDITSLINNLPIIISYIAYGLIYLSVFNFIRSEKKEKTKIYFLSCVAISFIIEIIFDFITKLANKIPGIDIEEDSGLYYLLCMLFTLLIAYISAKVFTSKWFNSLLLNIGIHRTTNSNIWNDISVNHTWLYIHLKNDENGYWGECKYIEENCSNPKIVLYSYQIINTKTGETVIDYSEDINKCIMVDTNDIKAIEITYNK